MKHHYGTKHCHFEQNYPQNSQERTRKISQMQASYQATCTMIVRSAVQKERGTEASLRVARVLGKHKKPFTDAVMRLVHLRASSALQHRLLCKSGVQEGDLLPFPKLKSQASGTQHHNYVEFLDKLIGKFETRFGDYPLGKQF